MRNLLAVGWFVPIAMLVAPSLSLGQPTAPGTSTLTDYVRKPDPAFRWEVVKTIEGNPATTYVVKLTSQRWLTEAEVDRPLWEHWLTIVKPKGVTAKTAFLFIGGGDNGKAPPDHPDDLILQIAEASQTVVAELKMVPNQPLIFHGDGVPREEDDLIGYAWDQYLKTGDSKWLPRLPMVKSAVRAMDCVQEFMKKDNQQPLAVEKFVVAGGSKRGWTTWMTGVADPRVTAIVPIVIDVVNVSESMKHHAAVYGFWTEAIGDYFRHGITRRWQDPRMREIHLAVDPYYHLDRLKLPKFMVNAAGDEFFCPDSSQFYFDALPGEKHLRYVPNADHSLEGTDALKSIIAFYQLVVEGRPRPEFSWTFEPDGSIRVATKEPPRRVRLWQATNPKARDFRLETLGKAYQSTRLEPQGDGVYVGRIDPPAKGWTAFFVEMTYDVGARFPLKFTTAVRVLPDVLPFAKVDPTTVPYELEKKAP